VNGCGEHDVQFFESEEDSCKPLSRLKSRLIFVPFPIKAFIVAPGIEPVLGEAASATSAGASIDI
jgi:hypothetical protein